jgi:hypothetical protein
MLLLCGDLLGVPGLVDDSVEPFQGSSQRHLGRWRGAWVEGGQTGPEQPGIRAVEEEGGAESGVGDPIVPAPSDPFDEAVQP